MAVIRPASPKRRRPLTLAELAEIRIRSVREAWCSSAEIARGNMTGAEPRRDSPWGRETTLFFTLPEAQCASTRSPSTRLD